MRHHDWQIRLETFLGQRRAMPFAWGANDCATFAADCVLTLTGTDPALDGMRKHTTAKQAARTLKRHGGLVGIATAALGEPLPASMAQPGDVVLSKSGEQDMLAICNGCTALAPSATGLVSVEIGDLCWRVS